MTPLPERIHQIIDNSKGILASRLCAQLSTEYLSMSGPEIRKTLITMIEMGEISEIEYRLPDLKNESVLLPVGTKLMGFSSFLSLMK